MNWRLNLSYNLAYFPYNLSNGNWPHVGTTMLVTVVFHQKLITLVLMQAVFQQGLVHEGEQFVLL